MFRRLPTTRQFRGGKLEVEGAAEHFGITRENNMIALKIEGMSCMHCVKTVTEALSSVTGVAGTPQVTLDPGEAVVEGDASPEALVAAVEDAGYKASVKT